ncbi:MAG: nodulation protein NfeD [Vicinamibacterales bacterium]
MAAPAVVSAILLLIVAPVSGQPDSGRPPVVFAADVESIIHPVSAEFMIDAMNRADEAGATALVFTLRTPGGLVDSTRDIVTSMLATETPVVVFVGPAGARAASAGFILTIAADVAAMAPGTHIGAAHPVSASGEAADETVAQKAAEDLAAYVRTLATSRQRNVPLSEEAVNDSRAFTETEALNATPPLIDLIATDLPDLLAKLDGRTVRRFDGSTTVLDTTGANVVPLEMTTRQRILSTIANPNIAYMLLSLGILGLTIELWNPGGLFPGILGGLALLLAAFALQLLPVNYVGVLLIVLGLGLLALEMVVTSFGLLTVGGLLSLLFGTLMLVDATTPGLQLNLAFVLPVVAALAGISMLLVRLGVKAQRQPAATGEEGMLGLAGVAVTAIEPGSTGHVKTHGEIWQAVSNEPVPAGAHIRVVGMEGLTLTVRKE